MNTVVIDTLQYKRYNLEYQIKKEFPDFEVIDKRNSLLMKMLSKVLFFNPNFMTRYITVIGNKVYVPKLPWLLHNPYLACEILAHEWVHMKDNKRLGIWFKLLYLFPQILALLCLLGFWNPWFFFCLFFILPWPALWRAKFELRGYTISMAVRWWLLKKEPNFDLIVNQFTTSAYYYMYPFPDYVKIRLIEEFERIRADQLEPYEKKIKNSFF